MSGQCHLHEVQDWKYAQWGEAQHTVDPWWWLVHGPTFDSTDLSELQDTPIFPYMDQLAAVLMGYGFINFAMRRWFEFAQKCQRWKGFGCSPIISACWFSPVVTISYRNLNDPQGSAAPCNSSWPPEHDEFSYAPVNAIAHQEAQSSRQEEDNIYRNICPSNARIFTSEQFDFKDNGRNTNISYIPCRIPDV